jgi:uncharacterized protein (DUF1330 family)
MHWAAAFTRACDARKACGYFATAPYSSIGGDSLARKRNAKTTEDGKSGDIVIAFDSRKVAKAPRRQ